MISKIVQKEKERQEGMLLCLNGNYDANTGLLYRSMKEMHEQSLINLKEYMEETIEAWKIGQDAIKEYYPYMNLEMINQLTEDIKELTEMIKKYE